MSVAAFAVVKFVNDEPSREVWIVRGLEDRLLCQSCFPASQRLEMFSKGSVAAALSL